MERVVKIVIIFFLFLVNSSYSQISVFYGTESYGTFPTLTAAKIYIRNNKPTLMLDNIYVNIPPGEYNLSESLMFDQYDSGTNGKKVIYRGIDTNNKPFINSGHPLTGWIQHDPAKNIWKTSTNNYYARQLYVNGQKAIRARSAVLNTDNSVSSESAKLIETKTGYLSTCYDFTGLLNVKDMEVVSNVNWRCQRIPVDTICKNQLLINTAFWNLVHLNYVTTTNNPNEFLSAPAAWLENNYNLINVENESYIDKAKDTIYYKPLNSINSEAAISTLDIRLPKLESLIIGNGVSNVEFSNICFAYTTWNKPSERNTSPLIGGITNNGFWSLQADVNVILENSQPWGVLNNGNYNYQNTNLIPAAISFIFSNNIRIRQNEFKNIGSTALSFGHQSFTNVICKNKFDNISASAIRIGESYKDDVNPVNDNYVINNEIYNIANEYYGSIGIFIPYARKSTIENNYIYNFPYTGISVGWGWNYNDYMGINEISKNRIDCSNQIMADGAGIYTLSNQGTGDNNNDTTHWTKIEDNFILNQKIYLGAIYLDQASSHILVKNNLIDISNSLNIQPKIKCRENSVSSIIAWSKSRYVNIIDNSFNNKYIPPQQSLLGANCSSGDNDCISIISDNNTPFTGEESSSNTTITQSGIDNSCDCYCP